MTEGLDPAPLATTPEAVARVTAEALDGVGHTVWAPAMMRWVMLVLRHAPAPSLQADEAVSAARMSDQEPRTRTDAMQGRDMAELRERRRRASNRKRLLRLDLGLGVLAAILLLIISPGLAITGLMAVILLLGVLASIVIERRRRGGMRERRTSAGRAPED